MRAADQATKPKVMIFRAGKWLTVPDEGSEGRVRFRDIWFYYANLIDYCRVLLCVIAAFTLVADLPGWTVALLLVSILLDEVDGPVARAYDQCSMFGSGVDWLADILFEAIALAFWAKVGAPGLPLLAIATTIDVATAIFDFATTTTNRYPLFAKRGGFFAILDWCMPECKYSRFGTFVWLSFPIFVLAVCLDYAWPVRTPALANAFAVVEGVLGLPALLYVWCELAYLVSLIEFWSEAPRRPVTSEAPGCELVGIAPAPIQELLRSVHDATLTHLGKQREQSLAKQEVFWVNLWQATGNEPPLPIARVDEVARWAKELVETHYAGTGALLDGYGFITNPIGSKTQPWHIDYEPGYSTLFIPLSLLTPRNAVQYLELPASIPPEVYSKAIADLDRVDFDALVNGAEWVSVRQLIAKPFSIIRMGFNTIHRGITNSGDFHRDMFWVSVKKPGAPLPVEPVIEVVHKL